MKTCTQCHTPKPLEDFYPVKRTGGHTSACKACTCVGAKKWREANPELFRKAIRKNQLLRKYGIGLEEYEAMRAAQGGACLLCGGKPESNLHVDHDHGTGAVRGLLCRPCNTGLGMFQEDAALLRRAASYLEER